MNISSFFINRPIFATVVSIIITLIGFMSVRGLAVEQYPQVVPPTVSVSATYPGASAQVLSETVASVLTQEINGVQDMIYITSTSADSGQLSMSVYFRIGTDPDQATIDVNNRVQRALSQLPTEVQNQGVTVEQRSSSVLLFTALYSPNGEYDRLFLNNYANINILDEIRRLPGVGNAEVLGNQDFAMRIWLNPDKLSQYDLTPSEVSTAIQTQNTVVSAGKLNGAPQREPGAYTYTVTTQGRMSSAQEFRNILLRTNEDGSSLKLSDVARVELGSSSYGVIGRVNGSPIAPIAIYQQPGANALEVAEEVKTALADMKQRFPAGLDYVIPYDTTLFIDASIEAVSHTFIEALLLVAVIVFVFLQNWRSTLVAMSVVPISVVGTFGGMYLLDFSINLLSLFGMILAIGIVVDDAIVVIENIERILEEEPDTTPMNAAFKAMKEVTGPVMATSFIMASVFIPVAFISGMTGQMYRQFAITIAISVGISALVALSFTPAIAAIFIKRHKDNEPRWLQIVKKPFVWFNKGFDKITSVFMACVGFLIRHFFITMALFAGCCFLSWWLYSQLPAGLIPATDQGVVLSSVNLPAGSSVERTDEYMQKLSQELETLDAVDYVTSIPGYDLVSGAANTAKGTMFISMKPWSQRDLNADELIGTIMQKGAGIPGGQAMAFNLPPIIGLSPTGGLTGFLQSLGGAEADELFQASQKIMQAANEDPAIAQAFTTLDTSVPTYHAEVDREKAQSLGVNLGDLNTTLSSTFGSAFVNYFTRQSRNFQVYLQSEDEFRQSPENLNQVYVRGGDGQRIPLSALVTMERQQAPTTLDRYNVYPAAKFQIAAAPGYSNGQAMEAVQRIVQDQLGTEYSMGWTGEAYQQENAGNAAVIAIVFGIVMVFLILAAQYESWTLPLAVIASVPFAFLGAVLAVWLRDFDTSVYLQVGMLVVVGLAAKNAILIVEFAQQQRAYEGLSIVEAAKHAALQRFRPIVMTSLAFIGGTLPLALATGASEASRNHIGTPVVGGMITITILASLFVPATYVYIMQGSQWASRKLGIGQQQEGEAQGETVNATTGRSTHSSDDDNRH